MTPKLRFGLLLAIIALAASLSSASDVNPKEILRLVNTDRAAHGLPALSLNETLNSAALAKAQHMLKNNYFDHVSPTGTNPWQFFKAQGYQYQYAGENLALNFTDAGELEHSWMNSPKHRNNILSPYYSDLGLAVVKQNNQVVVVQFFGTQASLLTYQQ